MFALQSTFSIQEALVDMAKGFLDFVPNVVTAIVLLLVGWIAAKMVQKVVSKLLEAAKIDKLGESLQRIDMVNKANIDIKISKMFSKIIYYIIMLMVLILSSSALGIPEVTNLMSDILKFLPNLLVALIVLILGTILADTIKDMVLTALKSLGVPSANMIANVLFYFLFINIVMIALKQANIETDFLARNISILIAGLIGAFAIGYGLASKDTMSNMLASFYSNSVFKVGDKVTIDGVTGTIESIDKTKITLDTEKSKVVMPLAKATNQTIEFHKD